MLIRFKIKIKEFILEVSIRPYTGVYWCWLVNYNVPGNRGASMAVIFKNTGKWEQLKNIDDLKFKIIDEMCGYIFTYKGDPCGMEPIVESGVFTFDAWSGDKNKDYTDIDELITDKLYSGNSLTEFFWYSWIRFYLVKSRKMLWILNSLKPK